MDLTIARKKLNAKLSQYETAKANVKSEREALVRAKENLAAVEQAQQILQTVAATVQQHAHAQIASLVTRCLQSVFEEPYEFVIHFHRKRGKTEAEFGFKRGKYEVDADAVGGGVIDVASFALRLACLMLTRPQARKLVLLDEPFKFVHGAGNRARAAELLQVLAKETGFQFIIATGLDWLQVGKVVEVG